MKAATHTRGPWRWLSYGTTIRIDSFSHHADGADFILGVAHINPAGNSNAGIPTGTNKANARLIAASPDLLEALDNITAAMENVLLHLGEHMTPADRKGRWQLVTDARIALAKTGLANDEPA